MKDKSVFKKLNTQLDKLQAQREQLATDHKKLGKEFKQLKQIEKNFDAELVKIIEWVEVKKMNFNLQEN